MQLPLAKATDKLLASAGVPGIMALEWIPSFGNSTTTLDPASIAAKEFYGRVRAAFSGSLDADAPDFITYIGALDSIFAYIGWLKRLYRTISSYTPENYMLPDGMIAAFGLRQAGVAADLRTNKVRLWQGINELILKSRKYKCPAVMDLFNRHYWMSDNVYADANSTRAQLYIFNLTGVYKVGDVTEVSASETITGLIGVATPFAKASGDASIVDTFISFGNQLIEAMDAWDDGYLISGYLQRAFDGVPSFSVAELLQDELLTTSYVPEVLAQIENSKTVLPGGFTYLRLQNGFLKNYFVSQNAATNAVVAKSQFNLPYAQFGDIVNNYNAYIPGGVAPMLNIRSDAPTVADNVIASRLHAYPTYTVPSGTIGDNNPLLIDCVAGTEVPWCWGLYLHDTATDEWIQQPYYQQWTMDVGVANNTAKLSLRYMFNVFQFDWHPFSYIVAPANSISGSTGVAAVGALTVLGDTFNPTVISVDDLKNLHKVCMYSELNSFGI